MRLACPLAMYFLEIRQFEVFSIAHLINAHRFLIPVLNLDECVDSHAGTQLIEKN